MMNVEVSGLKVYSSVRLEVLLMTPPLPYQKLGDVDPRM